jgi:hypothetical protein
LTLLVFDRRNGEGDINEAPVLALSNCLIVINTFAAADTFEDHGFCVMPIRRNEDRYGLTHCLFCGITKEELGAAVPSHDDAIEILGKINHILQLLFNSVGQHGRAFFNMDLCGAHELALFGRGSLSKHARCRVDK